LAVARTPGRNRDSNDNDAVPDRFNPILHNETITTELDEVNAKHRTPQPRNLATELVAATSSSDKACVYSRIRIQ